jgi:hypothetical protein
MAISCRWSHSASRLGAPEHIALPRDWRNSGRLSRDACSPEFAPCGPRSCRAGGAREAEATPAYAGGFVRSWRKALVGPCRARASAGGAMARAVASLNVCARWRANAFCGALTRSSANPALAAAPRAQGADSAARQVPPSPWRQAGAPHRVSARGGDRCGQPSPAACASVTQSFGRPDRRPGRGCAGARRLRPCRTRPGAPACPERAPARGRGLHRQ